MGDGIQKKYALIVNGDGETRHLSNVDRAIRALSGEGAYEISVASVRAPIPKVDHFAAASSEGLTQLLNGMKSQMDDDDLLVVYFTGHGNNGSKGEGCVSLPNECLSLNHLSSELKKLSFGKRILVMDNCYSGSGFNLFTDSKSTVVSQGSPGEKVSCQLFSPFFWSDQVPDADQDGKISIQERFQFAVTQGKSESLLQYFSPEPISLSGNVASRPFRTANGKPIEVSNGKELKAQLARLKPGQVALVDFSADWCVPCKSYQPFFEKLAQNDGGRVLMIHAEGKEGSEEDWAGFGIKSFPTVAFVDWNGKVSPVADPKDPMASLAVASVNSADDQAKIFIAKLGSDNPEERYRATRGLRVMESKAAPAVPALAKALQDSNAEVRLGALQALAEIGPAAAPAVPALRALLKERNFSIVLAAAQALGKIGPQSKEAMSDLLQLFQGDLEGLAKQSVENNGFNAILNEHMVFDKQFELAGAISFAMAKIEPENPEFFKTLLSIAEDPKQNYSRRQHSVRTLGNLGDRASPAIPHLIALFDDEDLGANCQNAIVQIGKTSKASLETVAERAADKTLRPFDRYRLLDILSRVGAPVEPQKDILWKIASDLTEDPRLRKKAAKALAIVAPSWVNRASPILAELEHVSLSFDNPRRSAVPKIEIESTPSKWSMAPSLEFTVRDSAVGGGLGLWGGYRPWKNFELRLGASIQTMHLAHEKKNTDLQAALRVEPVFHPLGAPEKSGPNLTLGEIGVYHLLGNGVTGLALAPLGVGYTFKVGESSALNLGIKGQANWQKEWKPGASAQFGWITEF